MTDVLAIIGGATTAGLIGLVIYLVIQLVGFVKQANASKDLYEKQREATDAVIVDRDALTVALATERDKSKTLRDRLGVAESERNDATRALAAKVGEAIKNAPDAAGALAALNDILAVHLPGAPEAK